MFSAAARAWLAKTCRVTLSIVSVLGLQMEIAVRIDGSAIAGRDAHRGVFLCHHGGAVEPMAVQQFLADIERHLAQGTVVPDRDQALRWRRARYGLLFHEGRRLGGSGDH